MTVSYTHLYEMQWMWKSSKYRPWHAGKNREAQAVRNANCTCWNLRQKKGWYGMSIHDGDYPNVGTKRYENLSLIHIFFLLLFICSLAHYLHFQGQEAVSYTHLDVYKRQFIVWPRPLSAYLCLTSSLLTQDIPFIRMD